MSKSGYPGREIKIPLLSFKIFPRFPIRMKIPLSPEGAS
jgi:hypothetical protein